MGKLKSNGTPKDTNSTDLAYKFEKVEGTPFTIYGTEEDGYILLMGENRLTNNNSKEETIKEANSMNWDKILQVMIVIAKEVNKGKI